ncbi:twin-arginine protein translocation system subunit TatC [Mannheimia haemolytica]|nr:twin-arginine protein translocation system subunit TatC [Mannheimia haemolytica]
MSQVDESQPLITHLIELRNRLLRSFICVLLVFLRIGLLGQ